MANGNQGDALVYFPLAYLGIDNGDLESVTDFTITLANQGKVVKTQRRGVAGVVKGKDDSQVTFNASLSEDGAERNWVRMVQQGTIKTLRAKSPGGDTYTVTGIFTNWQLNAPLEDAVTIAMTFIGKMGKV